MVSESVFTGGDQVAVLLILPAGFEDLEAAAFVDVLGWCRDSMGDDTLLVDVCGLGSEVRSARGVRVIPDLMAGEVDAGSYRAVALPGGYHNRGYVQAYDDLVLEVMRSVHEAGGYVATICVGALVAGEAGLLQGRRATTYPHDGGKHVDRLVSCGAQYTGSQVENDGRVITGNGPGSALGVAWRLVEVLCGADVVREGKRLMCMDS